MGEGVLQCTRTEGCFLPAPRFLHPLTGQRPSATWWVFQARELYSARAPRGVSSLPLGFSIRSQGRGPVRHDGCFKQGSFTVHAHRGVFLEAKSSPWRCSAFVSAPSPWLRSTFVSTPSPWRRSTFVPTEMKAGG